MFKVITIIVLAISCLTSTLLAQSNFLERNNSAFSVFGGVGSSGEDHGYKTIVIGISRAKGFDLNIARIYQTNPQANNFSANFSFYLIDTGYAAPFIEPLPILSEGIIYKV